MLARINDLVESGRHDELEVKLKVLEINKFQRENSDKAGVTIWAFLTKVRPLAHAAATTRQ